MSLEEARESDLFRLFEALLFDPRRPEAHASGYPLGGSSSRLHSESRAKNRSFAKAMEGNLPVLQLRPSEFLYKLS